MISFLAHRVKWWNVTVYVFNSWWFSIDRRDADKQLMLPGNPRGTFLIRVSGGMYCIHTGRLCQSSLNVYTMTCRHTIWLDVCFVSAHSFSRVCFTFITHLLNGRVMQSVRCVSVCVFAWLLSNDLAFDLDMCRGGSPWPYLGQVPRSESSAKVHVGSWTKVCEKKAFFGCAFTLPDRQRGRPEFETVAARIVCVCRVMCAKSVGATSCKGFLFSTYTPYRPLTQF